MASRSLGELRDAVAAATQKNLELMDELAEKAEEHSECEDLIANFNRMKVVHDRDLEAANRSIQQEKGEKDRFKLECERLRDTLSDKTKEVEDMSKRYQESMNKNKALKDQIDELKKKLDAETLRKKALETELDGKAEELARLNRDHEDEVKLVRTRRTAEFEKSIQDQQEVHELSIQGLEWKIGELEDQLRAELLDSSAKITERDRRICQLERIRDDLQRELDADRDLLENQLVNFSQSPSLTRRRLGEQH